MLVAYPPLLSSYWCNVISFSISDNSAKATKIPFFKDVLLNAIRQFNSSYQPTIDLNDYPVNTHKHFGCYKLFMAFSNLKQLKMV